MVRRGVEAWNQQDADLWLSDATPEIEWMPAGPATVESTRLSEATRRWLTGFAPVWGVPGEEFRFECSLERSATSATRCSGWGA